MTTTFFPENITLCGALGGEYYEYHKKAVEETQSFSTGLHAVLATLESIPILSSVIVLIEYALATAWIWIKCCCCCYSQPPPPPPPVRDAEPAPVDEEPQLVSKFSANDPVEGGFECNPYLPKTLSTIVASYLPELFEFDAHIHPDVALKILSKVAYFSMEHFPMHNHGWPKIIALLSAMHRHPTNIKTISLVPPQHFADIGARELVDLTDLVQLGRIPVIKNISICTSNIKESWKICIPRLFAMLNSLPKESEISLITSVRPELVGIGYLRNFMESDTFYPERFSLNLQNSQYCHLLPKDKQMKQFSIRAEPGSFRELVELTKFKNADSIDLTITGLFNVELNDANLLSTAIPLISQMKSPVTLHVQAWGDVEFSHLPNLDNIVSLNIFRSNITSAGVIALPHSKTLRTLSIADGKGINDEALRAISIAFPNLTDLTLRLGEGYTQAGLDHLLALNELQLLGERYFPDHPIHTLIRDRRGF